MEKKKFLFVSYAALINDIACQVCQVGRDVKYFIKDKVASVRCFGLRIPPDIGRLPKKVK